MATLMSGTLLPPARETRLLVIKWVIALLVPLLVFTFVWNGEAAINQIIVGLFIHNSTLGSRYDWTTLIGATIFFVLFYGLLTALAGYAVAADSGRQNPIMLWISMVVFTVVPIVLISIVNDLFVGISFSVLVWVPYFLILRFWHRSRPAVASALPRLTPLNSEEQASLVRRAIAGGFWFGLTFAVLSLVVDLIYFFSGQYGTDSGILLIWIVLRTVLLPLAGYFLGRLS